MTSKSKYTWLFDAGHGGIINGKYQTRGKCSPNWERGVYYEGVGNRKFVKNVMNVLTKLGVDCIMPIDTNEDIPLKQRTDVYNELWKKNKKLRGISIHSNAGGGEGFVVFTTEGQTESDIIGEHWFKECQAEFPKTNMYPDRRDGDGDREENFWVIHKTAFPFILTENLFMDKAEDYFRLWDESIRRRIEKVHVNAVLAHEGREKITLEEYIKLLGDDAIAIVPHL